MSNQILEQKTSFPEQSIVVFSGILQTPAASEIDQNTDNLVYSIEFKMPVVSRSRVALREVNVSVGVENIDTDEFYNINKITAGRIDGVSVEGLSQNPTANGTFTAPTFQQEKNVVSFKCGDAPVEFRGLFLYRNAIPVLSFLIPLADMQFDPDASNRAKITIAYTVTFEYL